MSLTACGAEDSRPRDRPGFVAFGASGPAEVLALRAEVARLRAEVAELRLEVASGRRPPFGGRPFVRSFDEAKARGWL